MDLHNSKFNNNLENENLNNKNQNQNNHKNDNPQYYDDLDDIENLNINQILIDDSKKIEKEEPSFVSNKLFNIKANNSYIYIENINQFCTIKIPKSFKEKISIVDNNDEFMNKNTVIIVQANSIIGIFDLNDNKYLGVITSSTEIIKFMDSHLYIINSIELIQITNNKESKADINLLKNIKNIFSTGNFYYSNDYDISLSLYKQNINDDADNNIFNSKYLINSSLLKYFIENNIPDFFFCSIIFGYIAYQKDIFIDETTNMDIVIIERYFNKNIVINNDIPGYIKQVEQICVFKNKNNRYLDKIYSYIFYVSSESMKYINKFLPFKTILINELKSYNKIICILNDVNKLYDNMKIYDVITKFNKSLLNNKIEKIDFTSNLEPNIFFNNIKSPEKYIDFYFNDSDDIFQENVFWFIDINNSNFNDDIGLNAIMSIIWKVIQKEIDFSQISRNIGLFWPNNNSIIYSKINEIILKYKNDLMDVKRPLLGKNRDKNQEIIEKFFSYASIYEEKENKIDNEKNKENKKEENKESEENQKELKKIKILCTTWNIAGIPTKNYNISELFSKNVFNSESKSPDIIIMSFQEIVKLNFTNILSITSNQESVAMWTKIIKSTLKNIYPKEKYLELICLNLVGILILILIKNELKDNIFLVDHNTIKTGMYGTLGNKGFFTISLQCYNKIICVGSGHFEAGKSKNEERINTLIQLLNMPINIKDNECITFKDVDYWIILGDLNFRIDLSYEEAISLIQEKNYNVLYDKDQFNNIYKKSKFLKKYMNEKKINFDPTYKYEKESNEYAYDEDKVRVPAWTDRIFFSKKEGIKMLSYDCVKNLRYSDHRPVVGAFEICVIEKKNLNKKSITNNKIYKKNDIKQINNLDVGNNNININMENSNQLTSSSNINDKNNNLNNINIKKNDENIILNLNNNIFNKNKNSDNINSNINILNKETQQNNNKSEIHNNI